jgi:glycosyl transferase, family 25
MKIYVINLARAFDRRQKMEDQAKRLRLTLDFIEATDGQFLTNQERSLVDLKRRKRVSKYPLTDNEIGCWISHRRAMQRLVDSGDAMATILEDDAKLLEGFCEVLAAVEKRGAAFDFIDLHRLLKKGEIFRTCGPLFSGVTLGRVGLMHMHATSYIMSRAGAQKFLAYSARFVHAVDKEMHRYWANGLDIYGFNKRVVVADDGGFSYIDETRKQDRPKERLPLRGADTPYAWLQRKREQLGDSVRKRLAFPAYVRRGRKAWCVKRPAGQHNS